MLLEKQGFLERDSDNWVNFNYDNMGNFLWEMANQHKWLAENLLEMVDDNKSTYNKYMMYKEKYNEAVKTSD